jgi:ppGpp synthetase/RelA/SpoT-type nucleotidyltranferase
MEEENEKYAKAVEHAENIVSRVGKLLFSELQRIGNPALVRAVLDKRRIKDLNSIIRKAQAHGWSIDDAIEQCWDFVGFRVVCNNLQDQKRAADLFEHALRKIGLEPERHDYVAQPQASGYRAMHLTFPVAVTFANDEMRLNCEIQLRTRLQDAWGHLSREDLYGRRVPKELSKRMRELSDTLAEADAIAEEIRKQVSAPRVGERPEPDAQLNASALAFIFHRAFGEDAPDYLIESALDRIGKEKIRADALDEILNDQSFRSETEAAYEKESQSRWPPDPDAIFEWALCGLLRGKEAAISLACQEGKERRDEIEAERQSMLFSK